MSENERKAYGRNEGVCLPTGLFNGSRSFETADREKTLIVGGELNDEDMILLRDWIKKTPIEKSLRTVDLSGVSGISHLPARMFARCRRLREAVLAAVPLALGSQTFAYTPELLFIHTEQITEIDTFDCFAFCESLPGLNFAGLEQAGSFSFRKSVFKDSVSFPKLKLLPPYIFQETTVNGNLLRRRSPAVGKMLSSVYRSPEQSIYRTVPSWDTVYSTKFVRQKVSG